MAVRTIVFDAGDTLIKVDPAAAGSMAHWPQLQAVPGAGEMLAALAGRYRLAVASNAADSNAPLVKAGLARLGLDGYFPDVFTPAELNGVKKPDPAYFRALEDRLGASRSDLVMIGDGYDVDVTGAVQAGWQAVWYNPTGKAAPGLAPLHGAEINRLNDLPAALDDLKLPTLSEAKRWLIEQDAGNKLQVHVTMVAALAYQLAVWLRQAGVSVNPVLAHRGGLLHDLAKAPARAQQVDHAWLAGQLLAERGQPTLAQIADRHLFFNIIDPKRCPRTWEEKLVYCADRLVERGSIVDFRQRLAAMQERHKIPMPEDERDRIIDAIGALEGEICRLLNRTPGQLLDDLRSAYFGE